jgi:hypothetical protein
VAGMLGHKGSVPRVHRLGSMVGWRPGLESLPPWSTGSLNTVTITSTKETYGCLDSAFDGFLSTCARRAAEGQETWGQSRSYGV